MQDRSFSPGFRFSVLDACTLLACIGLVVYLWGRSPAIAIAIAFAVAHFFWFCNIVRMARTLELAWTGVFVVMSIAWLSKGWISWQVAMFSSLVATGILTVLEMRKPSYHGVGWKWVNPDLRAWWEKRQRESGTPQNAVPAQ